MSVNTRKKKLVNLGLLLKMIGIFTSISCFAALAQVLLLSRSLVGLSDSLGEGAAAFRKELPEVLSSDVWMTLGFLVPFMLLVGLHITHKVAGPIYRISVYLEEVAQSGRYDKPCRVREGDELQSLVESINAAFTRLAADRESGADVVDEGSATKEEPESVEPTDEDSSDDQGRDVAEAA